MWGVCGCFGFFHINWNPNFLQSDTKPIIFISYSSMHENSMEPSTKNIFGFQTETPQSEIIIIIFGRRHLSPHHHPVHTIVAGHYLNSVECAKEVKKFEVMNKTQNNKWMSVIIWKCFCFLICFLLDPSRQIKWTPPWHMPWGKS